MCKVLVHRCPRCKTTFDVMPFGVENNQMFFGCLNCSHHWYVTLDKVLEGGES